MLQTGVPSLEVAQCEAEVTPQHTPPHGWMYVPSPVKGLHVGVPSESGGVAHAHEQMPC
jgi:hypothetical protein